MTSIGGAAKTAGRERPDAEGAPAEGPHPHRRVFIGCEAVVAIGGLAGGIQLFTGTATPPVSDLRALGLHSWDLPALWLVATTAVPASVAGYLAWRRSPFAPAAVLVASSTLLLELLVQIPFIGPSPLQVVFGTLAVTLAVLALRARSAGWWHRPTR